MIDEIYQEYLSKTFMELRDFPRWEELAGLHDDDDRRYWKSLDDARRDGLL